MIAHLPLISAVVGLLILAALPALIIGYDRRLSCGGVR